MKLLKKSLKITFITIALLSLGLFVYSRTFLPKYSGELEIDNLSETVTVYFDEIGVPHINAQNQRDAYLALGYVHAQDRLWQMELIRRIAPGRLSEVLGKDLLETDVFFAGLGIEEASVKAIANLDKNSKAYKLSNAYLEGINQYIKSGKTPLEFTLLGLEKENYTLKDIYNVFGYMSFSFAVAHKTDPLLTEIKEKLGPAYLNELTSSFDKNLTINKTQIKPVKAKLSNSVSLIMDKLPVSAFIGSNSWVIAPEKTKNGKVLFANDPHIGFSQPSVWYQNHIKTPDYEIYGYNIALMPFPLLAHNRDYAYGLTMLANDDLNFYVEENNPNNSKQYRSGNTYKDYELRDKTIKIKDDKDTTFQVKVSHHGPVMNNLISHLDDERPIAMNWIYTQLESQILDACYEMSHSQTLDDFKKSVSKIHAPGLNVMYGDKNDNIAWFAAAKLYQLRDSLSTKTFLNGASGKDEILEILPFSENPQAINSSWNYVYSANHQPDSVRGKLYPGYYQPQDRSKRIMNLLEAKDDFTKEDVAKMIYDVKSSTVSEITNDLLSFVNSKDFSASQKKAMSILSNWDGVYTKSNVGATIYNRFLYEFLKNTYKDELGDSFALFLNSQLQDKILPVQIHRDNSVWWDDVKTDNIIESKEQIITNSFLGAIEFLQNQLGENIEDWHWKRVISLEHEHAFGKAGGVFRNIFNVGPFETVGGNEVINNQIFKLDSTGVYKISAGPSTRRVIDFSDIENSWSVLPTGQSGNVFSPHYDDQAQKFVDGEFVKMKLNQSEIEASENILILKPQSK